MTAPQNLSMKTMSIRWMAGAAAASLLSFGGSAHALQVNLNYGVKLTNLTHGQILTPPLIVIHSAGFNLFTAGEPASDELAKLAMEGDTVSLKTVLESHPDVCRVQAENDPILPSASLMVTIDKGVGPQKLGQGKCTHISVVAMLANTNDAFASIGAWRLPMNLPLLGYLGIGSGEQRVYGPAYDAGAEVNDELCASIPGPACGAPGVSEAGTPENGVIHIHPGVHGIVDVADPATGLVPGVHDWRNPVIQLDWMTSIGK